LLLKTDFIMEGNDRPIKLNPTGKYNLDFIDWDNEYENICDFNSEDDDPDVPLEERIYSCIFLWIIYKR